jgi:hypothetical protein
MTNLPCRVLLRCAAPQIVDFSAEEAFAGRKWEVTHRDGTKMTWKQQVS